MKMNRYLSAEQNWKPRNKNTHILTVNIGQRDREFRINKGNFLPQIVLKKTVQPIPKLGNQIDI